MLECVKPEQIIVNSDLSLSAIEQAITQLDKHGEIPVFLIIGHNAELLEIAKEVMELMNINIQIVSSPLFPDDCWQLCGKTHSVYSDLI